VVCDTARADELATAIVHADVGVAFGTGFQDRFTGLHETAVLLSVPGVKEEGRLEDRKI